MNASVKAIPATKKASAKAAVAVKKVVAKKAAAAPVKAAKKAAAAPVKAAKAPAGRGRAPKKAFINVLVLTSTRDALNQLKGTLSLKSQGEVLDQVIAEVVARSAS